MNKPKNRAEWGELKDIVAKEATRRLFHGMATYGIPVTVTDVTNFVHKKIRRSHLETYLTERNESTFTTE